jgi:hypothetical protein
MPVVRDDTFAKPRGAVRAGLTLADAACGRNIATVAGVIGEAQMGFKEVIMTKHLLGGIVAATVFWPVLASAQTTVIETTGVAPPDEVVTYVQRESVPSVRIEGDIGVGYVLPGTIQMRTIPRHEQYGYAIINERRVIVEPRTRKVIRVIE